MKRFTVIALALVMSFSMLTACSSSEEVDTVGTVTEEPPYTDGDTNGDTDDGDLNSKVNMTGPEQMPDDYEEEPSPEE